MKIKSGNVVESLDFSAVKEKYVGKWVALSKDYKKVLAVGDSLNAVMQKTDDGSVVMQVIPPLGYAPLSK